MNTNTDNQITVLPDGSAFFIAEVSDRTPNSNPICWNPFNKVVQDHRCGTVHQELTDIERFRRGMPIPWMPEMADTEANERPIF